MGPFGLKISEFMRFDKHHLGHILSISGSKTINKIFLKKSCPNES